MEGLKLYEVGHPNYMKVIIIAESETRAKELTREKFGWENSRAGKIWVHLITSDLTKEFIGDAFDVT